MILQVVRGAPGDSIDALRALPRGFCEFGADEMSEFARVCKDAGLEELFLTSMKIYRPAEGSAEGSQGKGERGEGARGTKGGRARRKKR